MKKKLIAICLCVALAAVAVVGASLAYFTDTKSATNTFTVGNVKINLIESRYHRQGSGGTGDTTIPAPTQTASGMKYVEDGVKAFTNDEIKKDAETYATDYLAVKGQNMVPGKKIAKSPYYYKYPVAAGDETPNLIDSLSQIPGVVGPENGKYALSVEIVADAVQAEPTDAVMDAWDGATVDADGALTITGGFSHEE